jgi:hypothetical protein
LKVGVIAAKALNSVFNNESIESPPVLDPPVNESIAAVDESALGKIPELGMEKNAGQSDTQLMLTLPVPSAQLPSMSRIRREASPSVLHPGRSRVAARIGPSTSRGRFLCGVAARRRRCVPRT